MNIIPIHLFLVVGIKLQSQNRPQRSRKANEDATNPPTTTAAEQTTTSPVPPPVVVTVTSTTTSTTVTASAGSPRSSGAPASPAGPPSPAPSNQTTASKRTKSIITSERSEESESSVDGRTDLDTEGEGGPSEPVTLNEIELVFKPHPTEMANDNQLVKALKENSIRYLFSIHKITFQVFIAFYLSLHLSNTKNVMHPEGNSLLYIQCF